MRISADAVVLQMLGLLLLREGAETALHLLGQAIARRVLQLNVL